MRTYFFSKNQVFVSIALVVMLFILALGGAISHQVLDRKLSSTISNKSLCDEALKLLFLSHLYLEERLSGELPNSSHSYKKTCNYPGT